MSITVKNLHKDLAEDQLHEAKGFTTASNNTYLKKNHEGSSEWLSEYWLQPVLGVVTGSSAPPTENSGDRYILTGSSFNAGWDSPSQHEIVEYNGTTWVGIAAVDGMRVVDLSNDSVYYFNTAWNQVTDANTDTTYAISAVDSGDDAIIRLTAGGSGSGTDDVTLVAGSNITLTPSGDNITIASTASGGASDLDGLADVKIVEGSTALANSIFIANGTSPGAAPQHGTLSNASRNLAIMAGSLAAITSGDSNICIGFYAGNALTTQGGNVLIGDSAGKLITDANAKTTAIGYGALDAATTGTQNTALGYNAGSAVTLGDFNTLLGSGSGDGLENADKNIIIGYEADGAANSDYQIAIGSQVATTQTSSLILGQSGQILLHGDYATAGETKLGVNLGNTWTAPTANLHVKGQGTGTDTALLVEDSAGDDLLKVLDNGSVTVNNAYTLPTAVTGANDYVLTAQTDGTTAWAAASGGGGASDINGLNDCEVGSGSGLNYSIFLHNGTSEGASPAHGTLSNAQRNIAMGANALGSLTSGDRNIAFGYYAGVALTTQGDNVLIGSQAGTALTSDQNVAIGSNALDSGTSALANVAIGNSSGHKINTGDFNVTIGASAGDAITSGSQNVSIGVSSDCAATVNNQIAIGYTAVSGGVNTIQMGNSSIATADIQVSWTVASDERVKDNITDTAIGLDFINALRPVTFTKIHPADYPTEIREDRYKQGGADYDEETEAPIKGEFDTTTVHDGLIAQEVKATMDSLGVDFSGWKEKADGRQGIQYEALVMPLIKAVQELSAKVTALENA